MGVDFYGSKSPMLKDSVCVRSTAQCGMSKSVSHFPSNRLHQRVLPYKFYLLTLQMIILHLLIHTYRYDEGTAFMPIVEHKRNLPVSDKFRFMALDEDGYDLPSDW